MDTGWVSSVLGGDEGILRRDAVYVGVRLREGVLERLDDVGLGGEFFDSVRLGLDVGLGHISAEEVVVVLGNVLDLGSEGTHALELPLGG